MEYVGERLKRTGEGAPAAGAGEQHGGMRSVQNLEAVINEGLRVALLEETPDQSLEVLLEHLGKALHGDRTYIFERNAAGGDDNTYEWAAEGVEPEKDNLQNVPPEVCASWYQKFSIGKHIVIESLEDIRETNPLQYENLKRLLRCGQSPGEVDGIRVKYAPDGGILHCFLPETPQPVP